MFIEMVFVLKQLLDRYLVLTSCCLAKCVCEVVNFNYGFILVSIIHFHLVFILNISETSKKSTNNTKLGAIISNNRLNIAIMAKLKKYSQ
jgi:hypothetical protein